MRGPANNKASRRRCRVKQNAKEKHPAAVQDETEYKRETSCSGVEMKEIQKKEYDTKEEHVTKEEKNVLESFAYNLFLGTKLQKRAYACKEIDN